MTKDSIREAFGRMLLPAPWEPCKVPVAHGHHSYEVSDDQGRSWKGYECEGREVPSRPLLYPMKFQRSVQIGGEPFYVFEAGPWLQWISVAQFWGAKACQPDASKAYLYYGTTEPGSVAPCAICPMNEHCHLELRS